MIGSDRLSFSVVVPTHNRPQRLHECLGALSRQDYPTAAFEVVIVDDGGEVDLEPVVRGYREALQVSLLTERNRGPAAARNRGAASARGRYLAFTDDDCQPDMTWLSVLARHVAEAPEALLGGRVVNGLPDDRFAVASQLLTSYLFEYYNRDSSDIRFLTSNNMAVEADRFRALGGFGNTGVWAAAEDRELSERWRTSGHRLDYVPDAVVYHFHDQTLRRFWRQHFTYGRGAHHFHVRRAADTVRPEPPHFYSGLLRYPFRGGFAVEAGSQALLLVLSQIANAFGFLWERMQRPALEP